MRLVFLITVLFPSLCLSLGHRAIYRFKYMVFNVGTVEYQFTESNGTYEGVAYGYAQGIASLVSGGRKETHMAKLRMVNGTFSPVFYSFVVVRKGKLKRKWMSFEGGRVKVEGEKVKRGKVKRKSPYFIDNATGCFDPISLFENFVRPGFIKGERGEFSFCIITPTGKKKVLRGRFLKKGFPKPLEAGERYVVEVKLPSGVLPFKSKKVYLYFTDKMVLSRAYIENVVFFGDLWVKLERWETL